ncbi:MAG: 3-deoxy-D-manno-octulosonate 8-phosphate phosphatase [Chitinophagaceae bacterium]|nr:MAG: 3-deoxy-D-manno-octulosonate 8-phosphate phosphatase [Chitinophagaceae bacterium]
MSLLQDFKNITCFVFDMDGVLTDGKVLLVQNNIQARQMNVKDGLGLQMALKNGYRVIVISGGNSIEARNRLKKLGLKEVYLGVQNKLQLLSKIVAKDKLIWNEILFMGDDLPDFSSMKKVGISCCPSDAVIEIKNISKYISPYKGGDGCVRDVLEKSLKAQGRWNFENSNVSSF